jgi:hypothetical protein
VPLFLLTPVMRLPALITPSGMGMSLRLTGNFSPLVLQSLTTFWGREIERTCQHLKLLPSAYYLLPTWRRSGSTDILPCNPLGVMGYVVGLVIVLLLTD